MNMFHKLKILLVVSIALLVTACVLPKTSISSLDEVAGDELIIVGKLQLSPHIKKDEVELTNIITFGSDDVHKSLRLIVSDVYFDLGGLAAHDYSDAIFTLDGDYFYFTWKKNKPLHILGTSFITRSTQTNIDTMTMSIKKGLRVKHRKNQRAIYVGTITFKRDEFFNIKDIDISQKGYKKAKSAFKKKFKTRHKLNFTSYF